MIRGGGGVLCIVGLLRLDMRMISADDTEMHRIS